MTLIEMSIFYILVDSFRDPTYVGLTERAV